MESDNQGCRVGVIQPDYARHGNPYYDLGFKFITSFFPPHLNCSYLGFNVRSVDSSLNESGMYDTDSAYGALQDNRVNILAHLVSLKSFENPSVFTVDVPLVEAEAIILNAVPSVNHTQIDILETFNTFEVNTYYFTLVILCLTIGWFKWIMKWSVYKSIWACITGLLDQVNDESQTIAQRILWLFFQFFILVGVLGFWGGLISADMTVSWTPRRIEKLEDILNPNFNATPFFFKHLPIYSVISNSSEGSIQKKIFKRAEERGSVFDMAMDKMDEFPVYANKFFNSLANPNDAYLDHDVFVKLIVRFACFARNIKEPIFVTGKEPFGKDTFVFPYSSRLPKEIRHKANKHLRRVFEAGVFDVKLQEVTSAQMKITFFTKETVTNMECSSLNFFKEKEKYDKLHPPSPSPLSLSLFHGPLDVLCVLFTVCEVVFAIEWVVYLIKEWFFN